MRLLLLYFSVFLLGSLEALGSSGSPEIPRNIIYNYIQRNANFSVNPCDDFHAHVCPNNGENLKEEFFDTLTSEYSKLLDSVRSKYLKDDILLEQDNKFIDVLWKFFETEEAGDFCIDHKESFSKITKLIVNSTLTGGRVPDWEKVPCYQHLKLIEKATSERLVMIRLIFFGGIQGTIAATVLGDTRARALNLMETLRNHTREEFLKTPWAVNKNVVKKFVDALDAIPFASVAEYREKVLKGLSQFKTSLAECRRTLNIKVSYRTSELLCEAIALSDGWEAADFPKLVYDFTELQSFHVLQIIIGDVSTAQNVADKFIYTSTEMTMLMNSDYPASIYGGLGFTFLHEFMHSFVFSLHDHDFLKLKADWTNRSSCVAEQNEKTCKIFPESRCLNSTFTFEEDAADMAAYHLVWNAYLKTLTPGELNNDEEKKLFFYAFPALFCSKWKGAVIEDEHSSGQHRTNFMASQIPEFQELFKCKSTDRMVMNKAKKCVLYGEEAPENKRLWIGEDHVAAFG